MKIIDMHCDTICAIYEKSKHGHVIPLRENRLHVDLVRMKENGYCLQNFALFIDKGTLSPEEQWDVVLKQYQIYQDEIEKNKDIADTVRCYTDINANEKAGKLSTMLTVEEGGVCGGDIQKLSALYEMGVRMLTLTWNYQNELGFPSNISAANIPDSLKGLTKTGKEFVAKMEELHMIIDVSHLSDAGFYDVLSNTTKPFVASHSNARSICPSVRNMTDDMIRSLAERGGVMGLNFYSHFLHENTSTVLDIVKHAKHIIAVGGMECLGLGSDFDGMDTPAKEMSGVDKMGILWEALKQGGLTESQMDKVFFKNVLRVYKDTLK